MRLSPMKAITLSIRLSFHDSYELVTRDELVVVAESDDPGPRGRFACARSTSCAWMVTMFWLIVVFALAGLDRYTRT